MNLKDLNIDGSWTLFLDRDGVINRRISRGYVTDWEKFEFLPGVEKAIKIFSGIFSRIVVVTNQQGIGKGLMTKEQLTEIHQKMVEHIDFAGGRIDAIYYCPALEEENSPYRKPAPGMAYKAKEDFPGIEFLKSLMVGDTESDIEFGHRAGMYTVMCTKQSIEVDKMRYRPYYVSDDLLSFALLLKKSV